MAPDFCGLGRCRTYYLHIPHRGRTLAPAAGVEKTPVDQRPELHTLVSEILPPIDLSGPQIRRWWEV